MPLNDLVSQRIYWRLFALRRLIWGHVACRGLALMVVSLVAGVFLSFVIDRTLDMDRAQRGVIVAAVLAGVGYVLWRFLVRPLVAPIDVENMALVLERCYPQLQDRLISTLEFSVADVASTGASEALIGKVAEQADALNRGLKVTSAVGVWGSWTRVGIAAGAVVILLAFSAVRAEEMARWFRRNILFEDVAYPRRTHLTDVRADPGLKIARGGTITMTVVADPNRVVPSEVVFHKEFQGLGRQTQVAHPNVRATLVEYLCGQGQPRASARQKVEDLAAQLQGGLEAPGELSPAAMRLIRDRIGSDVARRLRRPNVFVTQFEDIIEPFEFRVTGNDDTSEWFQVVVVDPPELVRLAFRVSFPGYMNRPATAMSAEQGALSVPPGSRISLAGQANKPLLSGQMLLENELVGSLTVIPLPVADAPGDAELPYGVKGVLELPQRMQQSSLTLRIQLTDTSRITNPRGSVTVLRIERDQPPLVHLARKGVRGDISARAMIPFLIQVRDDHGISGLEATLVTTAPPMPATAPVSDVPAPTTQPVKRTYTVPDVPAGEKELTVEYGLDLEPLKLSIGQLVRVQAVAVDSLPESFGGPNRAKSAVHTFKIVTEEELLAELFRRQTEIREAFRRAVDLQAAARDRIRAVRDHLDAGRAIDAAVRRTLTATAADQGRIAANCAVTAQQMQDVLDEIVANRIGTAIQKRNLAGKIIRPLADISKKPMSDVAASLVRASKQTDVSALGEFSARRAETTQVRTTRRFSGIPPNCWVDHRTAAGGLASRCSTNQLSSSSFMKVPGITVSK